MATIDEQYQKHCGKTGLYAHSCRNFWIAEFARYWKAHNYPLYEIPGPVAAESEEDIMFWAIGLHPGEVAPRVEYGPAIDRYHCAKAAQLYALAEVYRAEMDCVSVFLGLDDIKVLPDAVPLPATESDVDLNTMMDMFAQAAGWTDHEPIVLDDDSEDDDDPVENENMHEDDGSSVNSFVSEDSEYIPMDSDSEGV